MKYWSFTDNDGENLIVKAPDAGKALEIARTYFVDPSQPDEISESEAERLGLDTY